MANPFEISGTLTDFAGDNIITGAVWATNVTQQVSEVSPHNGKTVYSKNAVKGTVENGAYSVQLADLPGDWSVGDQIIVEAENDIGTQSEAYLFTLAGGSETKNLQTAKRKLWRQAIKVSSLTLANNNAATRKVEIFDFKSRMVRSYWCQLYDTIALFGMNSKGITFDWGFAILENGTGGVSTDISATVVPK